MKHVMYSNLGKGIWFLTNYFTKMSEYKNAQITVQNH